MLCPRCGGLNDETLQFCRTCGMPLQTQPAPSMADGPQSGKLQATVTILGPLWIALALWSALGLASLYTLYHRVGLYSPMAFLIPAIQNSVGILLKALVAYMLLTYRSSGRMVAIVVAVFNLLLMAFTQASLFYVSRLHSHRFPAYTPVWVMGLLAAVAIYVYTLVVFAPPACGAAWLQAVAHKRPPAKTFSN